MIHCMSCRRSDLTRMICPLKIHPPRRICTILRLSLTSALILIISIFMQYCKYLFFSIMLFILLVSEIYHMIFIKFIEFTEITQTPIQIIINRSFKLSYYDIFTQNKGFYQILLFRLDRYLFKLNGE